MKTGIVLGYGLFSPEKEDYRSYLDFVAQRIKGDNLDKIILCGGFTDPKQPDKSEAGTMGKYLRSLSPDTQYVLEERSINTNQNIEFASKEIGEDDEVFVYCDSIRIPKSAWIAAHFILGESQEKIAVRFLNYAKTGVKSIDIKKPIEFGRLKIVGFDFSSKTKDAAISQTGASLVDVMSLYNEEIRKLDEEVRKEVFGL
jgi:hypothetical protein